MPRTRSLRSFALASNTAGSKSPPRARSPTFSTTTNASQINLSDRVGGAVITRADLRASISAYDDLISSCTAYRAALLAMSHASSNFANAMDICSRLKGVTDDAGVNLQAAGGLHYLMANHWDVLGNTLEQHFEEPLRQHLGHYRSAVVERSAAYERTLYEKSKIIKQTEAENMNYGRKKKRDLQSFRQALSVLQAEVDELDRLKVSHYSQILDHEEEIWDVVAEKVCLVVRSSLDVFDRVTAKASDSVLEAMVQSIPDPFDSYGPPKKEGQLFSILAPLAMTPDLDTTPDGAQPWSDELGISFPRTESGQDDAHSSHRVRRHSAPMAPSSSSSSPTTSALITAPSLVRRSQSHLPTILSVINEGRGKTDAQQFVDDGLPQVETDSQSCAPDDSLDCRSSSDITPTNTLHRSSEPRIMMRSCSPQLHKPGVDQDTSGGQLTV